MREEEKAEPVETVTVSRLSGIEDGCGAGIFGIAYGSRGSGRYPRNSGRVERFLGIGGVDTDENENRTRQIPYTKEIRRNYNDQKN